MMDENVNPDDVLKILIASDIHLGYDEKDPETGEDSFRTFEEILTIGSLREVDLILLGGDLFHESKPSQTCLHKALTLFRKYCMGDRPVSVEFLSDQVENFRHCVNPVVNYEDPNLNISIPVFSIHGNHDDPTGHNRLSSLDLLSASGLVNYFGKWTDLKEIEISPLLMRKGVTKLALYGLSYIKDERLTRLFRDRKVQLFQPKEETEEWFNIFVLHQNRADRGLNRSLPEDALPKFLDLVVWGHEHECRIIPEKNPIQGFSVIQPGSPVATSLCEGEAKPKHVAILSVHKKEFHLEPIKLKTVRPFEWLTVTLSKENIKIISDKVSEKIQEHIREKVYYLLDKAKSQLSGDKKQPTLPLIRVRVDYSSDLQTFNPIKFGLQFSSEVANPRDMITFKKERVKRETKDSADLDKETMQHILDRAREVEKVETVVEKYFSTVPPEKALQVLSVKGLNEAVSHFIEKSDGDAVSDLIAHQINKTVKYLQENVNDTEEIKDVLDNYRAIRTTGEADAVKEVQLLLSGNDRPSRQSTNGDVDLTVSDDEDKDKSTTATTSRGRGRGRGRGSRGGAKQTSSSSANLSRASASSRSARGKKQLEVSYSGNSNSRNISRKKMDFSDSDDSD